MLGRLKDTSEKILMKKPKQLLIGLLLLAAFLYLASGLATPNSTKEENRDMTDSEVNAAIEVVGPKSRDWGEIDMYGGFVEDTFQIKNNGNGNLELTDFRTSCMCTETQVVINGEKSPVFGMHSRTGWRGIVAPGETAEIVVGFDPLFHGPEAVGPITRLVTFSTNDHQNPEMEFKLTGDVVKINN